MSRPIPNLILSTFIGTLMLSSWSCGDDQIVEKAPDTDCRNNGVGCTEGFRCQRTLLHAYECLEWEEPNNTPLPTVMDTSSTPMSDDQSNVPGMPAPGPSTGDGTPAEEMGDSMPASGGAQMASPPDDEPTDIPAAEDCRRVTVQLKPQVSRIAKIILVVDRSPSMVDLEDRWTPTVSALQQMTRALEDVVAFGLMLFPNPLVPLSCVEGAVNIEPELNASNRILDFLQRYPPSGMYGGTPTALSLRIAGNFLQNDVAGPGERSILLATDGGPGCNAAIPENECVCLGQLCSGFGQYNPENCLDAIRTIRAVTTVAEQGVRTFVLGITSDLDYNPEASAVLDRMAIAGGTAINDQHYSIRRQGGESQLAAALDEAFRATAGSLAPCVYDGGSLQPFDDRVEVTVDGDEVPRDRGGANGWDLREGELEFFGPACEALRDGRAHLITASCPG